MVYFLFFDLTSRTSFINLKYWYNEIKNNVEDSNGIVFIIGNKLDLISNRAVTNEDILGFLEELDDKKYNKIQRDKRKKQVQVLIYVNYLKRWQKKFI